MNEEREIKVEEVIKDLRAKGLEDEEILKALEQMVQEQKLTEDEFLKAKEILDDEEKKQAEKLFGMEF
jgi:uncharacterized protein (DUF433 family)